MTDLAGEVARLQRRLDRERAARREAERIAEQGLRELYEANMTLDDRVARRTRELEEARHAALDAARAKSEFLANLSHEVRTPLQTIVAAIELSEPRDTEDRRRLWSAAEAGSELARLFQNLLDLAECEVGRFVWQAEPTDMAEIADRLQARWSGRMAAAGMLLSPEASGRGSVDSERLEQIGDLFLDNALRFAEPGLVQVNLRADGSTVELKVTDSGPGVAAEQLEAILEPFVQLHSGPERTTSGAGIGLALARGLAQQMGGEATVESGKDRGLTITVTLPDACGAPGAPRLEAEAL